MKGYTYLSSCRLASGGTKLLNNDLTEARWLVFRYINHMIKCINDFYEYVKNI